MAWKRTIEIRDVLTDDTSAESIIHASTTIIERLKGTTAPVARLEKAKETASTDPETALLVFNDALDRVYDWADEHRVWLS